MYNNKTSITTCKCNECPPCDCLKNCLIPPCFEYQPGYIFKGNTAIMCWLMCPMCMPNHYISRHMQLNNSTSLIIKGTCIPNCPKKQACQSLCKEMCPKRANCWKANGVCKCPKCIVSNGLEPINIQLLAPTIEED